MDMDSQLKNSRNTIVSLQEKLEACEGVYQNKIKLLQRELDNAQLHSGSVDSESQQDWENDSAFHSGTSSPTLSISSQAESPAGKHNLAEDVQAKYQQLKLDFEELGLKCDELQNQLSVSGNKLTHSLQEKAELCDKLGDKESEVSSLTEKLDIETDKSLKLDKELFKVSKNLINSQKLLRQFQTKKVNWANYYVDLEADYYNGLNYQLDHIYWLEGKCQKLERSNKYFKNRSYNSEAANLAKDLKKQLDIMNEKMKKQEHGADILAKDLKKQLDIMEKNMKTLETKNKEIVLQNNKLSETLAMEKQKSNALARELKICKEDLQKSRATNNTQKKKIKDLEEKFTRASLLCDCLEQEMDQFYMYAEYIGENWSSRKQSGSSLGRVVYDLTKCVNNTICMLDPLDKCGGDFDYHEPAWLTERRATRSLAKVKEKAKHEDVDG